MRPEEIPELREDGTSDHEVVNRQHLIDAGIEPVDSRIDLTCGTMTVAAGSKNPIDIRAVFAGAYNTSQNRCSAIDDCPYHFLVIRRHPPAKLLQILLPMSEKYITYGHGRIRS